jgi:hypothetical protein
MGFISTIVSDGASDAVRNPALLGFQTSKYSAGIWVNAGPATSIDFDFENNNVKADAAQNEMQIGAVFSWKKGDSVFAFALTNISNEGLYRNSEIEMRMLMYNEDVHADIDVTMNQNEKRYAPAIAFAAAFPLSGGTFFGIQGNVGVMTIVFDQHLSGTVLLPTPIVMSSDVDSQTKAYVFEAAAGVVQKFSSGQAGLLLRSGKLHSSSTDVDFSATYGTSQSEGTSNPLRYSSGMSIGTGAYIQPFTSFGLAFETEYRFPVEYRDNTIKEEDGHLEERPYLLVILSGGVLLFFEKKEKNALFQEEGSNGPRGESEEITGMVFTVGGSYRIRDAYLLSFTAGYMNMQDDIDKTNEPSSTLKIERFFFLFGVNVQF